MTLVYATQRVTSMGHLLGVKMERVVDTVQRKTIEEFPNYSVDTNGVVYRDAPGAGARANRPLKACFSKNGYHMVKLGNRFGKKTIKVHTLVLVTFMGSPLLGQECRHLNGNRIDNRLANLKWGTKRENLADRYAHGTILFGERHGRCVLSDDDVASIRRAYAKCGNYKEVARLFCVSGTHIRNICKMRVRK